MNRPSSLSLIFFLIGDAEDGVPTESSFASFRFATHDGCDIVGLAQHMCSRLRILLPFFLSLSGALGLLAQTDPKPLVRVHAHNDYEHTRPLLDALDHGFCSVEADVHLVDGRLLVAHDRGQVKPERTLEALYLDPLRERIKKNGGHIYPNGPEFILLVEIKGDWKTSYPVLREVLKRYADLLTTFQNGARETKAIRVIITGHRSREMFAGESVRYASLDGDLADLDSGDSADLIPWISSNWFQTFKWRGVDTMPVEEKTKLKDIVAKAHQQGRRVRFWGAPDRPAFWAELYADDVDLINTDDLAGAERFLRSQGS